MFLPLSLSVFVVVLMYLSIFRAGSVLVDLVGVEKASPLP